MKDVIRIEGARENNLNNISLQIPKFQFVVVTGPSGSGKSTLAMDTLQKECQRQYLESMGMVADTISKPKVDAIYGLSPSISVGQHVTNRNPRSTIGTVSDIYTLLRIVYAKLGERPCPSCGAEVPPTVDDEPVMSSLVDEDESHAGQMQVHCEQCGHALAKLTMSHFSFNKPEGACPSCNGLGKTAVLRMDAVFDESKSIRDGGVLSWYQFLIDYQVPVLKAAASHYGFSFDDQLPIGSYSEVQKDLLYYGVESEQFSRHFPDKKPPKGVNSGKFEGVVTGIWRRYREKGSEASEAELFEERTCEACGGAKIREESRLVTVLGYPIHTVASMSIEEALRWVEDVKQQVDPAYLEIVEPVLHDITVRMKRIIDVGLGYMSLDRQVITCSGGEAQRLRLASILGSGLTGVLYILDEPSAGLHPRDTRGLIKVLKQLRDLGNTVLVIEHDEEMMREADHIIDMGPGAGVEGGYVVAQGTFEELLTSPDSVTGAHFREAEVVHEQTKTRRTGNGQKITIHNADLRNLKNITVSLPLGRLISVTGVSGSGKSTLLFDVLAENVEANRKQPIGCEQITGLDDHLQIIKVDQSPLSRMQRSNIATYTDVYTMLRSLYAKLPKAKEQKLTAKHFSFNTPGGRCETCQGLGFVTVHMHFLPDIDVRCSSCKGKRFKEEVLRVTFNGYTISDLLDMSVQESLSVLSGQKKIADKIALLCEVGLGYLQWGQSLRTLSGGEGQRIKLAKELSKATKKHTIYLLDEPSTGLHPRDVDRLLVLLNKLVDAGNTVILVEHNLDLIQSSDWVIDIGPEGGEGGGSVVAVGTPEEVAQVEASYTGQFLREKMNEFKVR